MYFPVIRNNRNNWLDTAFNDLFDMDWTPRHVATAPAVNVKESDKAFTMEVAAPGLKKEYCTVNINNEGNLVVKIENKAQNETQYGRLYTWAELMGFDGKMNDNVAFTTDEERGATYRGIAPEGWHIPSDAE